MERQQILPPPNGTNHGKTTIINKTTPYTRNGTNHGETTHITKTTPFPPETVLFTKKYKKKERNRQNVQKLTIQTLSKVNQHNLDTLYMKSVSYFMIVEKLLTFVLYINLIYFGKLHGNGTLTILFSKSRKSNVENIPNVIKLMFSKIQM